MTLHYVFRNALLSFVLLCAFVFPSSSSAAVGDYTGYKFDVSHLNTGIAWDGAYLWVLGTPDVSNYHVRRYLNGTYTGFSFDTTAANNGAWGIGWDRTYFWITDLGDAQVYRYNADGTYSGFSFDTAGSGNADPRGIAWDGSYFWVVDYEDAQVYRYNADGTYSGFSFDTAASGNGQPHGIAWDGRYFWVTDLVDDEVYRYNADGTYSGFSFDTAASGNADPQSIAWDGSSFWIGDWGDTDVYQYEGTSGHWPPWERYTLSKPQNKLGLVGYWKFDEGTGTHATDFSGRGNDGTLTAGPVWVGGKFGKAVDLDGSDDYVNVNSDTSLAPSNITVSFWMKNNSTPAANDGIMAKTNGGSWTAGWGFHFDNTTPQNKIQFFIQTFLTNSAFATINTSGVWNHVVGTWDGTTIRLYVNGVEGTSDTYSGAITNTHPFEIGRVGANTWNLDGSIDEVRIYNRALVESEVRALYQSGAVKLGASTADLQKGSSLENGLVGHWTFDGKHITTSVQDVSGNSNHGYFRGGATSSAKTIGKLGQGLILDGVNDFIHLPNSASLKATDGTVSAWVKLTNDSAETVFAVTPGVKSNYFVFSVGNGASSQVSNELITVDVYDGSGAYVVAYTTTQRTELLDGGWHHVVVTVDTETSIYLDGNEKAVTLGSGDIDEGNFTDIPFVDEFRIGSEPDGSETNFFGGTIDDVRVYNRALSATEIQKLYQLGQAKIVQ